MLTYRTKRKPVMIGAHTPEVTPGGFAPKRPIRDSYGHLAEINEAASKVLRVGTRLMRGKRRNFA